MTDTQQGILASLPPLARYLSFEIISPETLAAPLRALGAAQVAFRCMLH